MVWIYEHWIRGLVLTRKHQPECRKLYIERAQPRGTGWRRECRTHLPMSFHRRPSYKDPGAHIGLLLLLLPLHLSRLSLRSPALLKKAKNHLSSECVLFNRFFFSYLPGTWREPRKKRMNNCWSWLIWRSSW